MLFAVLILGFLNSCSPSYLKVTVNGTVKDSGGNPIGGADITIELDSEIRTVCCNSYDGAVSNCKATTDSNGNWIYEYKDFLKNGSGNKDHSCTYTVTKSGYTTKSGSYSYCWLESPDEGECQADQTVATEIKLTPK